MTSLSNRLAIFFTAASFVLGGCADKSSTPITPAVVTGLAVSRSSLMQLPNTVDAVGTVHARESAVLSAQVMGRVLSVGVHEGDPVRAGQALIVLDDAQARSDVARAQAEVAASDQQVKVAASQASLAQSTLVRYKLLRDSKSVSPQEFDEVERRAQAASAALEAARSQGQAAQAAESGARTAAGYSRLMSPFAGVVVARHVDPGAMATPGMPLLEVERTGPLQLQAAVDESLLGSLKQGGSVPVQISSVSSQPIQGKVAEVVPAADPASRTFLVKINLPAVAGLRSGMFGTARMSGGTDHPVVVVPQSSLVTHGSMNGVWVLDANGIASLRYITLGGKHEANIEVLSGLSAGETVVLSPGDRELGGKRIEVQQ
ncbi:MAG: efflux RND transporter periplasmic adaptor subunit [Acidobacteria bacterium]|nr:efflux RND transporter periplasmic adaptor subunit [Acidobacteriota bacterium]MBW4044592.1 efflux RND transporter periplasmic adaptor subunit [Acidobacteriota bacterium]